jgi:hypothetical protein
MKVQNIKGIDGTTFDSQPYDVPNGLGKLLIAQGTVHEYKPTNRLAPKTTWGVDDYLAGGDPYISYKCASCGLNGRASGPTAHKTFKFVHCFVTEPVPAGIADEYVARRKSFTPVRPAKSLEQLAKEALPEPFDRKHFA